MKRTKRRFGPVVLLALSCVLIGETGCMSRQSTDTSPPPAVPKGGLPPGSPSDAPSEAPSAEPDETVAVVGGKPITRQQLVQQLLASYGSQTLRTLMLRMAVEQEAEAKGIAITDEEVDQELRRMSEGYDSEEEFYASIREQLGMDPEEVRRDAKYRLQLEQLAILPVEVPDSKIESYIREHPEEFGPRTEIRLSHIVVATPEEAGDALKELERGTGFEQLASERSIDSFTADSGGDMGWIDAEDPLTDPALLEAVAELDVGQTAGPVETASGYELVKLTGREVTNGMSPEAARREARKQLALEQAAPMADLEEALLAKYEASIWDSSLKLMP